jgi:hypothetical protein
MRRRLMWAKPGLAAVIALALVGLGSCSDDSTRPRNTTGHLQIYMVDSPAVYEDLEALDVIFTEVTVHPGSGSEGDEEDVGTGWITVMSDTLPEADRTFDLLELVGGVRALIGDVELQAGHYTQLRIIIESATVTIAGQTHPVTVPSGAQSGLKLTGGWDVDPGVVTSLTLDFDVDRSLTETPPGSGNFKLKPTIRVVQTLLSGTISGTVSPMGIGAVVSAYDAASDTLVTSTYTDAAGAYVLQALRPGTYDVEASASGYETARTENVDVQAEQDTGDIDFTLAPTAEHGE